MQGNKKKSQRYVLRSPVIGRSFQQDLVDAEFRELDNARAFLLEYMDFEESVLQLIYAAEEFESFLLTTALNQYLLPQYQYDAIQTNRLRANLKMLGFLNSITSLRDQFPKFRPLNPGFNMKQVFEKLWDDKKAASVAFRFSERLRNYAQHQTQPASSVSFGGGWDKNTGLMEDHMSVFVDVSNVCQNRNIGGSEKTLYEQTFGKAADVALVFRETMGTIGQIVLEIRGSLKPHLNLAVANYERSADLVRKNDLPALEAASLEGNKSQVLFSVFPQFTARAISLSATHVMINNQKHFISNRARGHNN